MKKLAIALSILSVANAQAAQVGTLISNHNYQILRDGNLIGTTTAVDTLVTLDLPDGKYTIQLVDLGLAPTQTASPSPTASASPTPSPTPTATASPSPSPTATASPSASPTVEPTQAERGPKVFVASYDKNKKRNRYEVIDTAAKSVGSYTEVLEGVATQAQIETVDLNGDGAKEVVAFGASPNGILLEYWNGQGQMLQSRTTLTSWHHFDIRFMAGDFDGEEGEEVLVMGRNQSGIYRFEAYDSEGAEVVTYPSLILGYNTIQNVVVNDVNGDGSEEVVVFGRTNTNRTEATVIGLDGIESPITLFGLGYSPTNSGFTIDLDGDGVFEIASVARHESGTFRLIVTDAYGQIRLKKNVLSNKFSENIQACAADVDGNGCEEIVISGRLTETGENIVQVVDHEGHQVIAHNYLDSGFKGQTTNLFSDIDQDQSLEFIVAGRDSMTGVAAYQVFQGGHTEMLYGGFLLEGGVESDPKVMTKDLDMDGSEDLIVTGQLPGGVYGVELRDVQNGTLTFQTTFATEVLTVSAGVLN